MTSFMRIINAVSKMFCVFDIQYTFYSILEDNFFSNDTHDIAMSHPHLLGVCVHCLLVEQNGYI